MSIRRYDFYDSSRHCINFTNRVDSRTGDFVLFTDCIDKVERLEAKGNERQAEVERLTAERDALKHDLERERVRLAGCGVAAMGYEDKAPLEPGDYGYSASYGDVLRFRKQIISARDAAVRERDAAVEILKDALSGFMLTQKGAEYPEWHWSVRARAALAKIDGEHNA